MSASSRMKIIIPLVSAMSLVALSAQAQDSLPPRPPAQAPAGPGAGAPPQNNQNMRKGPPQQAARPAQQPGGLPHAGGPGPAPPGAGGPPPGRNYARVPAPGRGLGATSYKHLTTMRNREV